MPRRLSLLTLAMLFGPMLMAAEPAYEDPAIAPAQRQHWAYRPPLQRAIPLVRNAGWVRTPIDAFILAKLEANGLGPSAGADRLTWLRRVTFDLIGLPPTPREQQDFVSDKSP